MRLRQMRCRKCFVIKIKISGCQAKSQQAQLQAASANRLHKTD